MNNIYVAIIVVYLIYYAGNIIYDGFLKKDNVNGTKENIQEYSIEDISGEAEDNISHVQIDDVENLNTPQSFLKREIQEDQPTSENKPDLEKWRQLFEAEQEMEDFERTNEQIGAEEEEEEEENSGTDGKQKKKFDIQKMLKEAETKVQVVAIEDGFKVYSLI